MSYGQNYRRDADEFSLRATDSRLTNAETSIFDNLVTLLRTKTAMRCGRIQLRMPEFADE